MTDIIHAFPTKPWTSCHDIAAGWAVKNLNFFLLPSAKRSLFFFLNSDIWVTCSMTFLPEEKAGSHIHVVWFFLLDFP